MHDAAKHNTLPLDIRNSPSVCCFRRHLKIFFYSLCAVARLSWFALHDVPADVQILIQRHPTRSSKRRSKGRGGGGASDDGGRRRSTLRGPPRSRRIIDEGSDSDGAMSARSHRRKQYQFDDDRYLGRSHICNIIQAKQLSNYLC